MDSAVIVSARPLTGRPGARRSDRARRGSRHAPLRAAELAIALALGLAAADAPAQIFTCKDPSGRVLTSDRPIPECAATVTRELRSDGSTRREIGPPMSREQREAMERAEQERKQADMVRQRELQRDRALVAIYPTVGDLERARKRQLDLIQSEIAASQRRMAQLHDTMKQAKANVANGKPEQKAGFEQTVQAAARNILAEDAVVSRKREEIDRVNQRFDDDGDRLRRALAAIDGGGAPVTAAATPR